MRDHFAPARQYLSNQFRLNSASASRALTWIQFSDCCGASDRGWFQSERRLRRRARALAPASMVRNCSVCVKPPFWQVSSMRLHGRANACRVRDRGPSQLVHAGCKAPPREVITDTHRHTPTYNCHNKRHPHAGAHSGVCRSEGAGRANVWWAGLGRCVCSLAASRCNLCSSSARARSPGGNDALLPISFVIFSNKITLCERSPTYCVPKISN